MKRHDHAGHDVGVSIRQGATIRQTIRDVRDAARATGGAIDAVNFIALEALTSTQVVALADVLGHLRAALATLDALAGGLASRDGETGERDTQG